MSVTHNAKLTGARDLETKMDDLLARLEAHARIHDEFVPHDAEQAQWAADLRAVRDEIAGLRKDAERYRWMCSNNFDRHGVTQIHTWLQTWEPHSKTGEPTEWTRRIRGGTLDAAIDAAMASERSKA